MRTRGPDGPRHWCSFLHWYGVCRTWAVLLLAAGVNAQFPFGSTMEGSEQLEAYIGVECADPRHPCRHAVDVRRIYRHTHPNFPDYRLALGPHAYISLSVSAKGAEGNYSVLLHQGNYSTEPKTAIGLAANVQGKSQIVTYGCQSNIFALPRIFITILCVQPDDVPAGHATASSCAKQYDLSFAIKKSVMTPGAASTHLVPPETPVVLAFPVQADGSDPLSPYDVSIKVESTFPENSAVSLGFLHGARQCSEHLDEALHNQAAAGWPPSQQIFQRVPAEHGDTTMFFVAVRSNSTKRALVRLSLEVAPVSGSRERELADSDEDRYLRRTLIGDRCFARGAFLEALMALQSAGKVLPDSAAARAKEYLVLEAAGALAAPNPGDDSSIEAARTSRERALYPLVREVGDALSSALAPLQGMRASRIRAVRHGMSESLALARRSLAESMAEAGMRFTPSAPAPRPYTLHPRP